ncbi:MULTISPECIES: tetratricopeptide repeat-containing protein [unclassified Synechococcus]|uniref:tetratricopeptide repeat-containing protein n=1 Tax=unclassified Synechococcus TaxID=2626047 RepID=UPI0020CDE40C|nr:MULTISPECIES: tetratricopeptide repeat-containing protein [unclassified Synechococcus]
MPVLPHAFVVMPFGRKPGGDGVPIDFNRIYSNFIHPALKKAGLEPFRADEEQRAGNIHSDMFQELLLADLVVADLTIDNPNVWYELGVRHALSARGVVLICGGRVPTAFDLQPDRKLRYGLLDGVPDPTTLPSDIENLADMVRATMESWQGRRISPVYALLPNLQEPDWRSLRVGGVCEFWEQHDAWLERIERARRANDIGDMLVLADEGPVAAFRAEAWIAAGTALRKAERFRLALEQLEKGLAIKPTDLKALQEKGTCLQRLAIAGEPGHSLDRARDHYRKVLEAHPKDAETRALAARVDKDAWVDGWRLTDTPPEQKRAEAAEAIDLLTMAIDQYAAAFRSNPAHYYSGINALTLMHLALNLTGDHRCDHQMEVMAGAVRFAAECEEDPAQQFWALATLADLEVLVGTPEGVQGAYRKAIARNDKDRFALESVRSQLLLLQDLEFQPETVSVAIATLDRAIEKTTPAAVRWRPRQAILFSGHIMDTPNRPQPRFPAAMEAAATERIGAALDALGAGADDITYCQAAAGGDLIFLEAALQRQVRCQVLLPFDEATFLQRSVLPSVHGEQWRDRYFAMKERLTLPIRFMPDELGPTPPQLNAFERCNIWLLNSTLACGIDRVRFIALWNGAGGDGPGGTAHLHQEVQRRTGQVSWIDTRSLPCA